MIIRIIGVGTLAIFFCRTAPSAGLSFRVSFESLQFFPNPELGFGGLGLAVP